MTRLRLAPLLNGKSVRVTLELPAELYRDLIAYGDLLAKQSDEDPGKPESLIPPMLKQFIKSDRVFTKLKKTQAPELVKRF
jgi:hypothetical protein